MRHEKITLVVLAYIIGFTTAFIGFGLNTETQKDMHVTRTLSMPSQQETSAAVGASGTTEVVLSNDGMYLVADGQKTIISGRLRDGIEPGPGFHAAIPASAVSPDGNYVYLCEQEREADATCNQYLYVVSDHTLQPLEMNGQNLSVNISNAEASWLRPGTLQTDGYVSQNPDRPWLLTEQ